MEPSITKILSFILLGILTSMGQVLILGICLYYIYKIGSKKDSILVLLGSMIWLLCSISTLVATLYVRVWGTETYQLVTYAIQGFSFFGSLLFVIGFFLLIRRVVKKQYINP